MKRALVPGLYLLLAGCVSSGSPVDTDAGREAARDAYVQLAIGYLQQGMTGRAKQPLQKALELDPDSADAHAALALVFQTEMESSLADAEYQKALASSPEARILNNYGSFLYGQGRYADAMERFRQAANDPMYPERGRIFENMGLTALRLGQPQEAGACFARALRIDGQRPGALLELATLAMANRQYVVAKGYYERFSALSEPTARSLLLGIRLAEALQQPDQAASLVLRLKRQYPASPEYKTYLSEHP